MCPCCTDAEYIDIFVSDAQQGKYEINKFRNTAKKTILFSEKNKSNRDNQMRMSRLAVIIRLYEHSFVCFSVTLLVSNQIFEFFIGNTEIK